MSDPDLRWATTNDAQSTVPPAPPAPPPVVGTAPPAPPAPPIEQDAGPTGAKEQAREVASTAQEAAGHVAHDAREHAAELAGEAKAQVRNLTDEARSQLRTQASTQTTRAAEGLHTLADQLGALLEGRTDQAGMAADYARQARARVTELATRLETGGWEGALDDVRRFARRRPGTFLFGAAAAGFLIGRTLRSAQANSGHDRMTSDDVVDLTYDEAHFGGPTPYGDTTGYDTGLSRSAVRSTPYDSGIPEPLPPTTRPAL